MNLACYVHCFAELLDTGAICRLRRYCDHLVHENSNMGSGGSNILRWIPDICGNTRGHVMQKQRYRRAYGGEWYGSELSSVYVMACGRASTNLPVHILVLVSKLVYQKDVPSILYIAGTPPLV